MSKRTFQFLLVACFVASSSWAAKDPFVGKWKLNPSKSKLIDYMKVKSLGANKYALDLGGGDYETVVADGMDQPGDNGTTVSVTVEVPFNWKVVRKKNGRTLVTGIWTLSHDGKTLSDHFSANRPNGSTLRMNYLYKRTEAGSGFAGTWVSTSEPHSAVELEIQPYEGDGLSFINPAQRVTTNIKFDGKDYRPGGPNIPPGAASSGRRVNERTLEIADKMEGKVGETREMTVSPDLKTITVTVHASGLSYPNTVVVFDRE